MKKLKDLATEGFKKIPLNVHLASALLYVGANTTLPERFNYLYNQKYNGPTAVTCNNYAAKEMPKYLKDLNKPLSEEDF